MRKQSNLTRQIIVRIEQDMYDWLEADAQENERTIAQSARFHLRRALSHVGTTP